MVVSLSNIVVADELVSKSFFGGVAINGHDSVAYHDQIEKQHIATIGDSAHEFEWKGATWRFATRQSRDLFAANPEQYAPAYNGFCANALSLGNGLKKTDGTHWQIFDGQLYVFYSGKGRDRWLAGDYREYKAAADLAWQKILVENEN